MVSVGVLEKSMSLLYAVVLGAPLTIGNVCVCVCQAAFVLPID